MRLGKFLKISLITVASIALLLILLYGAGELTSRPNFCANCHFMEPYVADWKTSTHSDITCTKCHFPPGFRSKIEGKFTAASMVVNYFTGVYKRSKPWAEIEDASCLRSGCHAEQDLNEDVVFKQDIHFNHYSHLNNLRRDKELRCTSCHSQIVQGEHMTVTESTCFLCHFKNADDSAPIDDCTWCHSAPVGSGNVELEYDHSFVVAGDINCNNCHGTMVVGEGEVLDSRCSFCHAEQGKLAKKDDMDFIHKMHVTESKVECENCHLPIQHKSISRTEEILPDCQECHQTPHLAQFDLFSGTGGKNVKEHPNPMFTAGLNCKACHIYHESEFGISGKTIATGESCERCHGEGYARIYQQWEDNMQGKIDLVELGFRIIENELGNDRARQQNPELFDEAYFNYQLVKVGNVVHNVAYSDELLLSSYTTIQKLLETNQIETELPDIKLFNTINPSECQNCHYGQESKQVEAFGISFDHYIHVGNKKLECLSCHSHAKRHGETTIDRNQCLSCHHDDSESDCLRCHQVQTHFYDGTIEIYKAVLSDYMYDGEVECIDCHLNENNIITETSGKNCSNCHDDEYDDILEEWQSGVSTIIVDIQTLLSEITYYDLSKENRQKIDSIRFGLEKIEKDGSYGAHNYELVSDLLEQYLETINNL